MKFLDLHCDTLMHLIERKVKGQEYNLYKNDLCIDLKRMKEASYRGQVFAAFVDMGLEPFTDSYYGDVLEMINIFQEKINMHKGLISLATSFDTYKENVENNLMSAFLSVEEGGVIGQDLSRLNELYNLGVRFLTLTWNYENPIGYSNHKWESQNRGLKPFGLELLNYIENLGIVADVSHLSDAGFRDVCNYSKRPFIATHSNSRAIQNHDRNLPDDMIKDLSKKGGLMGLAFAPSFLDGDKSSIKGMISHTKHILDVGGDEVLALGTDFDGISREALELTGAQDMEKLEEAFKENGLSHRQIENILYKNFENFLYRYENF